MFVLYRSRAIALAYDLEKYLVFIDYATDEGGKISFTERREFTDPLEAWTNYSQSVDCMVRRRIHDMKIKEKM